MLFDMHAHVVPDELSPQHHVDGKAAGPRIEPGESPATRTLVTDQMRFKASDAFFSAERRLESMDASGVDAEAVSPMPPLLDYTLPTAAGTGLSRRLNEFVARLCEVSPARLHGLGTVPLQDLDAAAAELAEVKALGLAGVEVGSNAGGRSIGHPDFFGFFDEAARLGLSVFVHATTPLVREVVPPAGFASFGFASEIGLAASVAVCGGLAERCGNLRLAFSHGAGGFPLMLTRAQWFWSRLWDEEEPADLAADDAEAPRGPSPSELARRFYYDTLVFDRRALRYLVDMLGPGRLLVGTDFPAMQREQPAGKTLLSMDLPAGVVEEICWDNCLRFLGVKNEAVPEVPGDGEPPQADASGAAGGSAGAAAGGSGGAAAAGPAGAGGPADAGHPAP